MLHDSKFLFDSLTDLEPQSGEYDSLSPLGVVPFGLRTYGWDAVSE